MAARIRLSSAMVGHQAIVKNTDIQRIFLFLEVRKVVKIIVNRREHRLTVVTALHDVMCVSGQERAGISRHGTSVFAWT